MSFIPLANNNGTINNNSKELLTPDPFSPNNLTLNLKEVNVDYRTSGNYYVIYSDMVSGMNPNHTMTWGCGNLDLKPGTSDWDCSDIEPYFSAYGAEGCEYIYIHSNCVPDPEHPLVTHTINLKVKDNQGDESNEAGITFRIHYTSTPESGEPVNPCGSY